METILNALAVYLSGSADPDLIQKLSKLIRFRPKDLPEADIVLPTLEVWKKCIGDEELSLANFEGLLGTENDNLNSVNTAVPNPWRFSKIFLQNEKILMKCDRPFLMGNFLPQLLNDGRHKFESLYHAKTVKIVNCELSLSNNQQSAVFCQLSEVRCNQVCQLLTRIYHICGHKIVSGETSADFRLNVGCADPKYLRLFNNNEVIDAVLKVGPVVDAQTKKKDFDRSLNDVYVQLFKCFYDISNERQDDNSKTVTSLNDVRKSVAAELQFQMLSGSVGQAICLNTECQNSDASFVLYNYARISQIIRTFEQAVSRSEYPPLPDVDQIDFSLLQENEEWEIFFNFIFPFTEIVHSSILEDCKGVFRLNKICQMLTGLSKLFSRYYNRVRVLREPLPHFLPTIFTRIAFLKIIKMTFEETFALLDIAPIRKM